jgi:regulator of sigma E protease
VFGNILLVALVIAILIFIHELGHLLACKASGIKVEKFSLGFGPALVKWQWAETTYMISAVPLGGYIKMEGEDFGDTGFFAAPLGKKLAVMVMGPSSNLLLGAVLFAFMFGMFGIRMPEARISPRVDSPAASAGLAKGDMVLSVNGDTIRGYDDLDAWLLTKDSTNLVFRVRRAEQELLIPVSGRPESLGIEEYTMAGIISVNSNWPAAKAGFKAGDILLSVDGTPISSGAEFTTLVRASVGKELAIRLLRGKDTLIKALTPRTVPDTVGQDSVGQIGISIGEGMPTTRVRVGALRAIWEALAYTGKVVVKTFVILYQLVTAQISARAVSGPVMVGKILYEGVQSGAEMLLAIWALLSINLFVVNMLPVPFLDGGRAVMFLAEGIRGKRISARGWDIALRIGLHLVVLLVIFALSNDFLNMSSMADKAGALGKKLQLGLILAYAVFGIYDVVKPQPAPAPTGAQDKTEPKQ